MVADIQDIPDGYKRTEVGVIPSDWELVVTGDHLKFKNGLNKAKEFFGYGFPIVNYMDVFGSSEIRAKDIVGKVDVSASEREAYSVKYGDVFFTRTSETPEEIGMSSVFLDNLQNGVFSGFVLRGRPQNELLTACYKKYCFKSNVARNQIQSTSSYTTRALTNGRLLSEVIIPAPKEAKEQKAIAKALTDADEAIRSLEAVIAKKRDVKQATLHALLTPTRRLPGFSGDWEETNLFTLADGKKEYFDDGDWIESEHIREEGIRLIQTGDIGVGFYKKRETQKFIDETSFQSLKCKKIKAGDLLICRLADPAGRACIVPDLPHDKMVTSVDVAYFRVPENIVNRQYLVQLFSSPEWFDEIAIMTGGTTHKRISRSALGQINLRLPSLKEQSAIATILTDMDAEIEDLEARLDKLRDVKQGMMQVLLTGKVRLI